MKVFLFSLRIIFGNKMFQAWSKQLENEGMTEHQKLGVFISQYSLQSQNTFFYVYRYIIFVFYIIVFTLQKVNSIHILGGVTVTTFQKLCLCLYIQSFFFLKLVHEFELLKQTFWLDVRRNILLYYLQVGGYSAENFNEIMLLELFNQGFGLQVCIKYLHTKFK